jgi:hypothetical protein
VKPGVSSVESASVVAGTLVHHFLFLLINLGLVLVPEMASQ